MFWIALAAQLSAPVPTNLRKWFEPEDMPVSVMSAGTGAALAGIRVDVAPDCTIRRCTVETSSKVRILDRLSCDLPKRRAKFEPAHWTDGSPAFGAYRTSISWIVTDVPVRPPKLSYPDLDLSVQALPAGIKSPSLVRVMFAVDASGKVSSCSVEESDGLEGAENNPTLVPIACAQLLSSYAAVPATDATGRRVPSVQDALVRFSVQTK